MKRSEINAEAPQEKLTIYASMRILHITHLSASFHCLENEQTNA